MEEEIEPFADEEYEPQEIDFGMVLQLHAEARVRGSAGVWDSIKKG